MLLLGPTVTHVTSEQPDTDDDDDDEQDDGNDDTDGDANGHLVLVGTHEHRVDLGVGRRVQRRTELAPASGRSSPNLKSML